MSRFDLLIHNPYSENKSFSVKEIVGEKVSIHGPFKSMDDVWRKIDHRRFELMQKKRKLCEKKR